MYDECAWLVTLIRDAFSAVIGANDTCYHQSFFTAALPCDSSASWFCLVVGRSCTCADRRGLCDRAQIPKSTVQGGDIGHRNLWLAVT